MKLVPKDGSQRDAIVQLGSEQVEAMRRWYDGSGDAADERTSLLVIRDARRSASWIECDCRPADEAQARMTPALLAFADTYYLRRLEGAQHRPHTEDCTFFRDQVVGKRPDGERHEARSRRPSGYFSIVRPAPESVSQKPEHGSGNVRAEDAEPRLARLLWTLIEAAHLNLIVSPFGQTTERMGDLYSRLRDAAATRMIAPSIRLSKLLYTFPKAFHDGIIAKELDALKEAWPAGHAPQAYMLLYVRDVERTKLLFKNEPPIEVLGGIQHPSGVNRTGGPYMALVAVGTDPELGNFGALRAWLQPVHAHTDLFPVMHAADRQALTDLFKVQRTLSERRIKMEIGKPLFDIPIGAHQLRPDYMLMARSPDGRTVTLILQLTGMGNDEAKRRKADSTSLMRQCSLVLEVNAHDALRNGEVAERVHEALMFELTTTQFAASDDRRDHSSAA